MRLNYGMFLGFRDVILAFTIDPKAVRHTPVVIMRVGTLAAAEFFELRFFFWTEGGEWTYRDNV